MGWPKGQGPIRSEASAKNMGKARAVGPMSKAPKLSSTQIKAIKASPAGVLPKFLRAGAGVGRADGVVSVGGHIGVGNKQIGASLGINKGKPFGTVNINGKVKKSFGPKKPNFRGE